MVARVSWNDLTDRQQKIIIKILLTWPDEQKLFTNCGSWLDEIAAKYNRGTDLISHFKPWHFVDFPLIDGCENFEEKDTPFVYNITSALNHIISSFLDPTTKSLWAINFDIRMLLHLVADVHTPVHCIDRYTPSSGTCKADHGANFFSLSLSINGKNLHSLWDSAVYAYPTGSFSEEMVQKLIFEYKDKIPEDSYVQNMNVTAWALHSYEIAKEYVYNGLKLNQYVGENDAYVTRAQPQAKAQIILASKRMAYIIDQFVKKLDAPAPTPVPTTPVQENQTKSETKEQKKTKYPAPKLFIDNYQNTVFKFAALIVDAVLTIVTVLYLMLLFVFPDQGKPLASLRSEQASELLQSLI